MKGERMESLNDCVCYNVMGKEGLMQVRDVLV